MVVGNPVRPPIRALAELAYVPPEPDGPLRLLVTGGSQGARLLSELMPEAVKALPEELRRRGWTSSSRPARSRWTPRAGSIATPWWTPRSRPFFRDMASRLRDAHLVIGRAGAGDGLRVRRGRQGRRSWCRWPSPLDDDQGQNAKLLADAGGAEIAPGEPTDRRQPGRGARTPC